MGNEKRKVVHDHYGVAKSFYDDLAFWIHPNEDIFSKIRAH